MSSILKKVAAVVAVSMVGFVAVPASADVPFGSGSLSGTDPLGHSWTSFSTGGGDFLAWGEPGLGMGTLTFNPLGTDVEPGVTSATGLHFTFLDGAPAIDQVLSTPTVGGYTTETRFNLSKDGGSTWASWAGTLSLADHRINFDALTPGLTINQGDEFFVNIHFATPVTPESFSFAANWVYAPVPEPEIYAMLVAGLGLMGFVARRRKQQIA